MDTQQYEEKITALDLELQEGAFRLGYIQALNEILTGCSVKEAMDRVDDNINTYIKAVGAKNG